MIEKKETPIKAAISDLRLLKFVYCSKPEHFEHGNTVNVGTKLTSKFEHNYERKLLTINFGCQFENPETQELIGEVEVGIDLLIYNWEELILSGVDKDLVTDEPQVFEKEVYLLAINVALPTLRTTVVIKGAGTALGGIILPLGSPVDIYKYLGYN